ncbi:Myotubularin-related protein 14 [Trichoplax sp. H2]|nr:Myotubularin-related protein 14 [Trichoplax sp. H2]|eukprot:RDD47133.1 Myotubularin-related protein 14 [Trichoplax sp. H2]
MAESNITQSELLDLLASFVNHSYKTKDNDVTAGVALERCKHLCKLDYRVTIINNFGGELCGHYPSRILLLQSKCRSQKTDNTEEIRDLMANAKFARCRSRFVVPVILYDKKQICRSSTLASAAEMYGRTSWDVYLGASTMLNYDTLRKNSADSAQFMQSKPTRFALVSCGEYQGPSPLRSMTSSVRNGDFCDRIRGFDIKLLEKLSVNRIFDLMIENKKVKFGIQVTSSEKVDKEHRYDKFSIIPLPYPGCEFFREYKERSYNSKNLFFDWNQSNADAIMDIPKEFLSAFDIDWSTYKSWDLLTLTKNYLKLILACIEQDDSGVLIHCISGWDRTPLFISLVRLSLWADGKIHQSLSCLEILYITVAYDWLLFGHQLPERLDKGEDIFYFCFDFLQYITTEEFSKPCAAKLPPGSPIRSNTDIRCSDARFANDRGGVKHCGYSQNLLSRDLKGHESSDPVYIASGSNPYNCYKELSSSCDSWQFIPETSNLSTSAAAVSPQPLNEFGGFVANLSIRRERLDKVRKLFIDAYKSTITYRRQSSVSGYIFDQLSSSVVSIVGGRGTSV